MNLIEALNYIKADPTFVEYIGPFLRQADEVCEAADEFDTTTEALLTEDRDNVVLTRTVKALGGHVRHLWALEDASRRIRANLTKLVNRFFPEAGFVPDEPDGDYVQQFVDYEASEEVSS